MADHHSAAGPSSADPKPSTTPTPTPNPPSTASSSSAAPHPAGHALRRARTVDESSSSSTIRIRRPSPMSPLSSPSPRPPSLDRLPRRSSNFSDYSLSDARDLLNPKARDPDREAHEGETSSLAGLSLAFALLPALAGALFKNGSALVTDVMLLGLAGIFLHWSVTQPWSWYHAAQGVRIQQESSAEAIIDEDDDLESPDAAPDIGSPLDDVPEEDVAPPEPKTRSSHERGTREQQSALTELYVYEVLALFSCFILPLLGAYLLHTIRSQLSRPSEGLVSNYNLTIFLLVSELRVFSHMIKLVQSRTLQLQRVVHNNPFRTSGSLQIEELIGRIERLEARSSAEESLVQQQGSAAADVAKIKQDANATKEARNAIQPELDALNRAVRRYEKKATILQLQTEARFAHVDSRLEDAVALAAAAAKNHPPPRNVFVWALESLVAAALWPFNALLHILLLPIKTLLLMITRRSKKSSPSKPARGGRAGKAPVQPRYNGDRVPTRVSKR